MSEVVNVVVALAVIVFVARWATSSSETPAEREARLALGFKPRNVSTEMLDTVTSMFPNIPRDNIRFDLLRTGNVETTTNKIIERGVLEAPPAAYYRIYPRTVEERVGAGAAPPGAGNGARANIPVAGPSTSKQNSLIKRYNLESRLSETEVIPDMPEQAGGKSVWETSAEKREANLRERKAQMILAARKRMLEQQQQSTAS